MIPQESRVRTITQRLRKLEDLVAHISNNGIICKNCGLYNNYEHICRRTNERKNPFTGCREWTFGEASLKNIYLRPQDTLPLN